jgi:hypothetical protein
MGGAEAAPEAKLSVRTCREWEQAASTRVAGLGGYACTLRMAWPVPTADVYHGADQDGHSIADLPADPNLKGKGGRMAELNVAGYRSIRSVRLKLKPTNALVGPNGCGKTNLCRSMFLLAAAASGRLAQTMVEEGRMPSVLWAGKRKQGTVRMKAVEQWVRRALPRGAGLRHRNPPCPVEPGGFAVPSGVD